ncbi:hypothetical protein vseg_018879 [Gypsophila vaccaria]
MTILNTGSVPASSSYATFDDPLFLSPTDQPTLQLVNYKFTGHNFIQWKRDIYHALLAKNKEGFIDGSCKTPPKTDKAYHQWIRCDLMVMKWILNSVEMTIGDTLQYVSSTKELWSDILDRFGQANYLEIYQFRKELSELTQDDSSLVEYYGKLKRTWENIDALDPFPLCTCGVLDSCSCQYLKRIVDRESNTRLIHFLMGLTDVYENVKTHVLTQDPLPPLNKALFLLQKIEKQKYLHDSASALPDSTVFASHVSKDGFTQWKKQRVEPMHVDSTAPECRYCHSLGHTKAECFKLKECTVCGRKGHAKENCFKLKYGSGYRGGRGGHTGSTYRRGITTGNFRRSAHNADRIGFESADPQAVLLDPLAVDLSSSTQDVSLAAPSSHYDSQFVEGLVHTIRDQVIKSLSDKTSPPLSSVNFAGSLLSAFLVSQSHTSSNWIVDTGASDHMTSNMSLLHNLTSLPQPILVGLPDGTIKQVTTVGDFHITDQLTLHKVLVVTDFRHNLLSVGRLIEDTNIHVLFTKDACIFQGLSSKVALGIAQKFAGLYWFSPTSSPPTSLHLTPISSVATSTCHDVNPLHTLHARLGHSSLEKLRHVMPFTNHEIKDFFCETCVMSKHHILPFPRSFSHALHPFDLIHLDVWGPYKHPGLKGDRFFLTILDDFSRTTWVHLFKTKCQVPGLIQGFLAYVENQFGQSVKVIRTDNGTEFVQRSCSLLFRTKGITHQRSVVERPQQNGRVERKHRHLVETARALRIHAHLPISFWSECILTACFLINKLPTSILQWKSPYEVLYGEQPCYDDLKIFGSLCYTTIPTRFKDKFGVRARKCVFIGYPFGQKGYKVYDLDAHKIFVSRDVIFREHVFPYKSTISDPPLDHTIPSASLGNPTHSDYFPIPITSSSPSISLPYSPYASQPSCSTLSPSQPLFQTLDSLPSDIHSSPSSLHSLSSSDSLNSAHPSQHSIFHSLPDPQPISTPPAHVPIPLVQGPRRSSRPTQLSVKLKDFHIPIKLPVQHSSSDTNDVSAFFTSQTLTTLTAFDPSYVASLHNVFTEFEPASYTQAKNSPAWVKAMDTELQALDSNNTWELTTLPVGMRAIGSKWVYKIKHRADGSVERFKARLVAKGYNQVQDKDYKHTFSPVAKFATVRVLLALASIRQWPIYQLDINNAFLHGYLDEEVYMQPPEGYTKALPGQVCKLKRSLYGLKQASRQWNIELTKHLHQVGFLQSKSDYSLFIRHNAFTDSFIVALVYVDDVLLTGNIDSEIAEIKQGLHTAFTIKDLGHIRYFLGLEVARNDSGILVNQRKYVLDILTDLNMVNCSTVSFPMVKGLKLSPDQGDLLPDPEVYRRVIGRLLYLTLTRPDIMYSVQHLSQFLSSPRVPHFQAALHVIKYLKGTINLGLFYSADASLTLSVYSDADWGQCAFTSRSLSGYCVFLGSSLVSWKTKKQRTVSKSSAEAEYRSMSYTTSEIVWMKQLLADLGVSIPLPIPLYYDNKAAQHIAQNPVFHERTKHLDIDCHFVRDKLQDGLVIPQHVRSSLQLADIMTKALGTQQHQFLVSKLGLRIVGESQV